MRGAPQVVGPVFGPACYITDSFPSMLYLAYKHADSFEARAPNAQAATRRPDPRLCTPACRQRATQTCGLL